MHRGRLQSLEKYYGHGDESKIKALKDKKEVSFADFADAFRCKGEVRPCITPATFPPPLLVRYGVQLFLSSHGCCPGVRTELSAKSNRQLERIQLLPTMRPSHAVPRRRQLPRVGGAIGGVRHGQVDIHPPQAA